METAAIIIQSSMSIATLRHNKHNNTLQKNNYIIKTNGISDLYMYSIPYIVNR